MTRDYRDINNVWVNLRKNDVKHLVFDSFKEAENSGEAVCVVLFEDVGEAYEIHVVGNVEEGFVEYAVWQDVEIYDDKDLAGHIWSAIVDVLTQPNDEDKVERALGVYGWYKTVL